MAVAFTFSPPLPFRAVESRANPLSLNILHVSTFASKILRAVQQPRPNELKDLACPTSGATARMAQFQQLSPILSRFYVQLLWIQRFCSCLPAKLMISKDHWRRVYTRRGEKLQIRASNPFAIYILPATPYYPKILLVFSRQADDSKRSPGEGIHPLVPGLKCQECPRAVHCPLTDTFECGMQKLIWWSRS